MPYRGCLIIVNDETINENPFQKFSFLVVTQPLVTPPSCPNTQKGVKNK